MIMPDTWEERYYYENRKPLCNDLQETIEYAKFEFDSHPAPYVVRVYDNNTKECVFALQK